MKKVFMFFVAALLMTACATPEERAAREAENLKVVKECVGAQRYKISVTSMTPMRSTSVPVTSCYLTVDGDELNCYLPYAGRDDIPQMKTRGERRMDAKLEFRTTIENYLLQLQPKKKSGVVMFKAKSGGDEMKFTITIDNHGKARIHLEPEGRDYIDYDGTVVAL